MRFGNAEEEAANTELSPATLELPWMSLHLIQPLLPTKPPLRATLWCMVAVLPCLCPLAPRGAAAGFYGLRGLYGFPVWGVRNLLRSEYVHLTVLPRLVRGPRRLVIAALLSDASPENL